MKQCSAPNCNLNVFSKGYCSRHQWMRQDEGYKKYKEIKKSGKIPNRTKQRSEDEERYKDQAKRFYEEAKSNKQNYCFFCGGEVKVFEGLHHLKGRTNNYLLDKEWWVIVHNDCHVWKYHQASAEQRSKNVWYNDFLMRLKAKSEELYEKELKKQDKARPLNLRLFDEDELI